MEGEAYSDFAIIARTPEEYLGIPGHYVISVGRGNGLAELNPDALCADVSQKVGVFENNPAAFYCYKAAGFVEQPEKNFEVEIFGEKWKILEMEVIGKI